MDIDDLYLPLVLFLAKRYGQGNLGRNLPLRPHTLETLDYFVMSLNSEVAIKTRKRRKDVGKSTVVPPLTTAFLFPQQHHRSSPPLLSRALRLDNNERQPPPQTPSTQPPQTVCTPHSSFKSLLSEDRYAEVIEQSDQINEIVKTHADELRRTLAEKWQMHYLTLLCAAEEKAAKRLAERELELETKTRRKNAELEQKAARFSAEAQAWEEKVKYLEEMVTSLRAALRQATIGGRFGNGGSRVVGWGATEDADSSSVDPERVDPVELECKACKKQVATVMAWPCRHLCLCRSCDAVTKTCPVCRSLKTAAVEVLLS